MLKIRIKRKKIKMISINIKKEPEFVVRNIKKESEFVTCSIKTEPVFSVTSIKKEPEFVTRSIKQEPDLRIDKTPNECATKITANNLSGCKTKSRKKKRKLSRKCGTDKKKNCRKPKTKLELFSETIKKEVQTKGSKSLTSKKVSKRQKKKNRKKSKNVTGSIQSTGIKREGRTLLDQQSSIKLRLFGFKDALDCFTVESDCENFGGSSGNTAKRTNLSRLKARNKVVLALKSNPVTSSSKSRHIIETPVNKNVDLLGNILNSQALWHSKDSKMKVKEDGSVEVISIRFNTKSTDTNPNSTPRACNFQESKINRIISSQKQDTTQPTIVKPLECDLFNKNEIEVINHVPEINIKKETPEICDVREHRSEKKIKVEVEEIENSPKYTSSVSPLHRSLSPAQQGTSSFLVKSEKSSDNEDDDCQILFLRSESNGVFSQERVRERTRRSTSNDSDNSDIEIIEIKENKRTQKEGGEESKDWARAWKKDESPSRKKESKSFQLERGRSTFSSRSRSPTRKCCNRSRSRSRSILAASTSEVKNEIIEESIQTIT